MAFPTRATSSVYSERWSQILALTEQMQLVAQQLKNRADGTDPLAAITVARASTTIVSLKGQIDALLVGANTGSPSFVTYAQGQVADSGLNLVTEWASLETAYDSLVAFLNANLPSIGIYTFAGGVLVDVTLTTPQRSALSTQLGTFIAEFA